MSDLIDVIGDHHSDLIEKMRMNRMNKSKDNNWYYVKDVNNEYYSANSYSQLAFDALDTVGLKDHALGKTAAHLLAMTTPAQTGRHGANRNSRRRKR